MFSTFEEGNYEGDVGSSGLAPPIGEVSPCVREFLAPPLITFLSKYHIYDFYLFPSTPLMTSVETQRRAGK